VGKSFGDTVDLVRGLPLRNVFASVASSNVPLTSIFSTATTIITIPCKQRTALELWHVRAAFNPLDASGKLEFFQCFLNIAWLDSQGNITQGGFGAYEICMDLPGLNGPVTAPAVANWGINYQFDRSDPLLVRQADLGGGASVRFQVLPVIFNTDGAGAHTFQTFVEMEYREVAQAVQ
jgi:hypothetical protein